MKTLFSIIALSLCLCAQAQDASKTIPKAAQLAAAKKLETVGHAQLIIEHYAHDDWATSRAWELVKTFKRAKHPADYTQNIIQSKPAGVEVAIFAKAEALKSAITDLLNGIGITPTWRVVKNQSDNEVRIYIGELDL